MKTQRLSKAEVAFKIKHLSPKVQLWQKFAFMSFLVGFFLLVFGMVEIGISMEILGVMFMQISNHLASMIKGDQIKFEVMK